MSISKIDKKKMADKVITQKGHPKGLYLLFVTEMWERFSYFGMRALFVLYLTKALLFDKAYSSGLYGSYTGLVYLTPLIGGYIADRYWGNSRSIIVGALIMAIGQFFMFLSGCFFENIPLATYLMIGGLTTLIIGNGFFKPNISTMVGQLYSPEDTRKDSAYTIFYMGVNLGAFIAPIICGILGDTGHPADFKWGFLSACVGMLVSLVVFSSLKDKFLISPTGDRIGAKPTTKEQNVSEIKTPKKAISAKLITTWAGVAIALFAALYILFGGDYIGAFIFSLSISVPGLIISNPNLSKLERDRIWVIYIVSFFVIFFWSAFEQAGVSLTYFAEEQTDRSFLDSIIPSSAFQSVNAVGIIIFAPIFALIWNFLRKKGVEPSSPAKQAIGLFLLAIGYLIIAFGVKGLAPGVKVSMMWLVSLYLIHTFGELCLSPIGMSLVNKLAPIHFASLLMAVWLLSSATANKFAGTLSSYYPESLIELKDVKDAEKEYRVVLLSDDYEKSVVQNSTNIDLIGFDRISFSKIKDPKLKDKVRSQLEFEQIENPKSILGYKISNLYDFFMLFVFMAGIASLILFFLNKKLVRMMHGIE